MFTDKTLKINRKQTMTPGIPGLATNHNQTLVRR